MKWTEGQREIRAAAGAQGWEEVIHFSLPLSLCLLFTVDMYVGKNGGGDISHQHTPGKQLKK